MKKIVLCMTLLSIALLSGCGKKEEKTEAVPPPTVITTPPVTTTPPTIKTPPAEEKTQEKSEEKPELKSEENKITATKDKSGAIRVNLPSGENQVWVDGKLNGRNDKVTFVIESTKGQMLVARVSATDLKANVRVAQIISPSGKEYGPFDIKIRHDLSTENGDWKVVVGEYPTTGESWKGDFKLLLSLY